MIWLSTGARLGHQKLTEYANIATTIEAPQAAFEVRQHARAIGKDSLCKSCSACVTWPASGKMNGTSKQRDIIQ